MDTYFAPAARVGKGLLTSQVKSVSSSPVMNAILQTTAGLLVVINENRQIVVFNNPKNGSWLKSTGCWE
jgi:hypothetical protein